MRDGKTEVSREEGRGKNERATQCIRQQTGVNEQVGNQSACSKVEVTRTVHISSVMLPREVKKKKCEAT
ncbi:hypothetical protein Pmani_032346 [Petrolisthes manimaculis]|uniref:Uncharacterized protein n=1 Tax=Petrolisthes manimaculis TaxID=1843537 RepID=A0AAE1TTW1_9EUCA|nr:hypothetical protein Pmani_032346 [Petrolisthes manimaculis]